MLQGTAGGVAKGPSRFADLTPGHPIEVCVVPLTALNILAKCEEGRSSFVTNDKR